MSSGIAILGGVQITTVAEDNLEEITCTQNKSNPRFLHASSAALKENEYGESQESDADSPYAIPMFEAHIDRQKLGKVVIDEDPVYEMIK